MSRTVVVSRGPEVQLLGDAVLLQGGAALDVYRVLCEGVAAVRRRDCIEPSDRLMQAIAALKASAATSSTSLATLDVQRQPFAGRSLRSGEVVGWEEVGRLLGGVSQRQVARLASDLGGWRGEGRGRPWRFDTGLVRRYLELRGDAAA